jgi:DNA mismatch endonuclease (patch repair protein)
MGDFLSAAQRSDRMSHVRQAGTRPELELRHALHAMGLRYRLNVCGLPGRPDLVFPKHGVAVFVHGCFWHSHHCAAGRLPATNRGYWGPKLEANKLRDQRKSRALRRLGWRVFTVWECTLKTRLLLRRTAVKLAARIRQS